MKKLKKKIKLVHQCECGATFDKPEDGLCPECGSKFHIRVGRFNVVDRQEKKMYNDLLEL